MNLYRTWMIRLQTFIAAAEAPLPQPNTGAKTASTDRRPRR
jgi:hypothetical protein